MLLSAVRLTPILLLLAAFANGVQSVRTLRSSGLAIAPIIQNLTFNEYYYQPSVNLIYQVNLDSLQKYIDPRFKVVSPYNNNSAYVVVQIGNMTAYYNGATCYHCITFTYLESIVIYTIVQFNNTLQRETLATSFNFTPPAVVGNLYQDPPYGSSMIIPGLQFSADNKTGNYHFSSSSLIIPICQPNATATIDLKLNYDSNAAANSTDQPTLTDFYFGAQNNKNQVQSSYRNCNNNVTIANDIRTGYLNDYRYTVLVKCTNVAVTSTYIKTIVGTIAGLDENAPVGCYYIPYIHYYSVAVTPTQLQK